MAEKEYIERGATLTLLQSLGSRDYRREKGTICDAIKMVMHPHYTPTADVVEVRYGAWITKEDGHDVCSECGRTRPYSESTHYINNWVCNYCHYCGAKMVGRGKIDA